MCIRTELTLSLPAWRRVAGLLASLSPVDFWIFQMWQEEEVLVMEDVLLLEDSDSEMFLTAEGGAHLLMRQTRPVRCEGRRGWRGQRPQAIE